MDGKFAGAAVNKIMEKHGRKFANIGMIAVKKEYRGLGIGRELCIRSLQVFKEEGIHEVMLETEVSNYPSLSLYEVC